jgi:hypothetical protein
MESYHGPPGVNRNADKNYKKLFCISLAHGTAQYIAASGLP